MIRRYDSPKTETEPEKKKTKPAGEVKQPAAETKMQSGPGENK